MDYLTGLGLRIGKAVLLGALMYFSLRALSFSAGASFAFALVPAILGSLNIMTGMAFTLTGLVFLVASAWALLKDTDVKFNADDAVSFVRSFVGESTPAEIAPRLKSAERPSEPGVPVNKSDEAIKPLEKRVAQ